MATYCTCLLVVLLHQFVVAFYFSFLSWFTAWCWVTQDSGNSFRRKYIGSLGLIDGRSCIHHLHVGGWFKLRKMIVFFCVT